MTTENNQKQHTIDELTGELKKATAERERALDVIRDNPDLISIYQHTHTAKQARKRLENDRVDFAKDKLAHKGDIADSNIRLRAATIKELANKYGCDARFLEELNLPTVTQIENVAIALGVASKKPGKRVTEPPEEPPLELDSGETSGGMGEPTAEQLGKMPMEQYARWRKKTMTK